MPADLFDDHRALIQLSLDLLEVAQRTPRPSIEELTQCRSHLGTRAARHLLEEDAKLIRPLLATGRIDELPAARETIARIREARAHYSNHVGKWTPAAIQADWAGYGTAVSEIIDVLRDLIAREERDLYWPALRLLQEEAGQATALDD